MLGVFSLDMAFGDLILDRYMTRSTCGP